MSDAARGGEKDARAATRMRAFSGNSFDDYYDHGVAEYPLPARALLAVLVCLLWPITKFLYPWAIEGDDLLCGDRRGRVIVMNHQSMLDPVVVVVRLWFRGVRVRAIYKSEFDKVGIVTWLFSRVGGIPVERGTADMKAVRRAKAALQRGECILIYPEGTRIRSEEEERNAELHGGYALMAQLAKAPVQPLAIIGARRLRFRSRVFLKAGRPIEWEDLAGLKRKEQVAEMERLGMARVYELRDELRRDHPGIEG